MSTHTRRISIWLVASVLALTAVSSVAAVGQSQEEDEPRFYAVGEVRNPGAYPLPEGATVRKALATAGGVTERAAVGRITITRVVDGKRVQVSAGLEERVLRGDTVMVPARSF